MAILERGRFGGSTAFQMIGVIPELVSVIVASNGIEDSDRPRWKRNNTAGTSSRFLFL